MEENIREKGKEREEVRDEELLQLVLFRLGDEEFRVNILQAREIEKLDQGLTQGTEGAAFCRRRDQSSR